MSLPPNSALTIIVGRTLLTIGMAGWFLLLISAAEGLPSGLQSGVAENSAMWALCSGGLVIFGIQLLWKAAYGRTGWRPSVPGQRFRTVVVYSREQCSLCDEALELLARYRAWIPTPLEVDIDQDPELLQKFNETVPVVQMDERIRFRGCISEVLLQRLIEGTPPLPVLRHR